MTRVHSWLLSSGMYVHSFSYLPMRHLNPHIHIKEAIVFFYEVAELPATHVIVPTSWWCIICDKDRFIMVDENYIPGCCLLTTVPWRCAIITGGGDLCVDSRNFIPRYVSLYFTTSSLMWPSVIFMPNHENLNWNSNFPCSWVPCVLLSSVVAVASVTCLWCCLSWGGVVVLPVM